MAPPRKRKSPDSSAELGFIAPQTVPINPMEEWDDDIREFMQSFDPIVFADYGCEDDVGNGIINDLDPQYMEFLANLVEGGSSYVLQVALGNGRSIIVNYEPDDGPVEECNPVDVVDTPIDCSSGAKTRKDMRSGKRANGETPGLNNRDQQREVSMVDLSYQSFLGALRRDGNKTVFMPGINEEMYDQNGESTSESDSEVIVLDRDPMSNGIDAPIVICLDDDGTVGVQNGESTSESDSEVIVLDRDPMSNGIDAPIVICLDDDGTVGVQNGESTSESDSEVIVLDRDPMSNGIDAPIVICLDDDGTVGVQNESSKFREGLMEVLKKPYTRREYVRLNKDVLHRRQVEQSRELRSGTKIFPTKFKAKSYLDLHPDLETQIESAKPNEPRILNLLRGFFYWLQNVTYNARFKPWLDASCLAVQPPKK